jgi:hypothetical protein
VSKSDVTPTETPASRFAGALRHLTRGWITQLANIEISTRKLKATDFYHAFSPLLTGLVEKIVKTQVSQSQSHGFLHAAVCPKGR